ncbi:MAG TPA: hypothetical protein VMW62_01450 [Chloroflexota bacterium]|nr:hypothetical protein [Chloroflexota bacterium]
MLGLRPGECGLGALGLAAAELAALGRCSPGLFGPSGGFGSSSGVLCLDLSQGGFEAGQAAFVGGQLSG